MPFLSKEMICKELTEADNLLQSIFGMFPALLLNLYACIYTF